VSPAQVCSGDDTLPFSDVPTWQLFVLLVLISGALAWLNNTFVMTPEVYRVVLGEQLTASGLDERIDQLSRFEVSGYVATPLVVWIRIALTTLIVQMFCLLGMVDIPFRQLFRVTAIGLFAPLAGSLNRVVWIVRQEFVDTSVLRVMPGSLASYVLAPSAGDSWIYTLLSQVSVFHVAWFGLMILGLVGTKRVGAGGAALAIGGAWGLVTFLRVTLAAYLQHFQT
jgi:hypothetical protein